MFILEEKKLKENLSIIEKVQKEAGVNILLAFKAFAQWKFFPLISPHTAGATASSLWEAKLCTEKFGHKAHTYSPAYHPNEIKDILSCSSNITFNSLSQLSQYSKLAQNQNVSIGLRVNPHYSDVETALYNPANKHSRLGVSIEELPKKLDVDGIHIHTLCESSATASCQLIDTVERQLAHHLPSLKWLNLGGGHLMTKKGYNLPLLINRLKGLKLKYPHLDIFLEPGSAFLWGAGYLEATVLDIIENHGVKTAVLDVSFTCHMPDTLEMPYRPEIIGASTDANKFKNRYRLGGVSCLAGDFLETYSFEDPLDLGSRIILKDMLHYTLVKTTMFNGVKHPSIALKKENGEMQIIKNYTYEDFKNRMC